MEMKKDIRSKLVIMGFVFGLIMGLLIGFTYSFNNPTSANDLMNQTHRNSKSDSASLEDIELQEVYVVENTSSFTIRCKVTNKTDKIFPSFYLFSTVYADSAEIGREGKYTGDIGPNQTKAIQIRHREISGAGLPDNISQELSKQWEYDYSSPRRRRRKAGH